MVDFDEADFGVADPDSHPDEVVLPEAPIPTPRHAISTRNGNSSNGGNANTNRVPANRPPQTTSSSRPLNAAQPSTNYSNTPQQPQTPNSGFARSNNAPGQGMRPPPDPRPLAAPQLHHVAGRVLNQPSRNGPPVPISPAQLPQSSDEDIASLPPQGAGFFSARAAAKLAGENQTIQDPLKEIPKDMPAFNLHAESPSIPKTPGIDHKSSKPLTRDLKHVPSSSQATVTTGIAAPKLNALNPHLDTSRRIGAPSISSPMSNRSAYKPPSMKRPIDGGGNGARVPLVDLPSNGPIIGDVGSDVKRQRLNG
jgi:DNA repair and recombination protein RAD52